MKRILLLAAVATMMAACAEAPTGPAAANKKAPSVRHDEDLLCDSGYIIAYDDNGNLVCIPDPDGGDSKMRSGDGNSPRTPGVRLPLPDPKPTP